MDKDEISCDIIERLSRDVKTLQSQNKLLLKAIMIAGKYARDNPPAAFPEEDFTTYFSITAGGIHRDPDGKEFAHFWINKASQKS